MATSEVANHTNGSVWAPLGPLLLALLAGPAAALESSLSSHATLATDRVHRGLSQTAGKASWAIGSDLAGERWFVGAVAHNSQLPTNVNPNNASGQQLELYAGYAIASSENWASYLTLSRYKFFGSSDYRAIDGYNEWAWSVEYDRFGVNVAIAPDAWGGAGNTRYVALTFNQPFGRWGTDLALGHAEARRSLNWTYNYLELGTWYRHKAWTLDGRLHWLDDERVNREAWSEPKLRFALSLTVNF